MKTIAILNQKGGVGKTTTATNFAAGLANKGKQVCLIDMDPQANSTDLFNMNNLELYIDDMLEGSEVIAYASSIKNLDVIPARLELQKAERNILLSQEANHNRLVKVIRKLNKIYDYIIIDCPPILNLLTVNALNVADEVIIPIKIDIGAEKGFMFTVENIKNIADSYDLELKYKVLYTMVNRNNLDKQKIVEITKLANNAVFKTTIRNQPKPVTQAGYNKEAVINQTKTPVALDYKELVKEFLKDEQ